MPRIGKSSLTPLINSKQIQASLDVQGLGDKIISWNFKFLIPLFDILSYL